MEKTFEFFGKELWFDLVLLTDLPKEFATLKDLGSDGGFSTIEKYFLALCLPENIDDWEEFFDNDKEIKSNNISINNVNFSKGDFPIVDLNCTFQIDLVSKLSDSEILDWIENSDTFNDAVSIMLDVELDDEDAAYPTSTGEILFTLKE